MVLEQSETVGGGWVQQSLYLLPLWRNGRRSGLDSIGVTRMCDLENQYNVYVNKDGCTRIYDKNTHKVTSYPRYLMEIELGRSLETYEEVHHIDGDPLNNDISNLEIVIHGEHQRMHATKYFDRIMVCPYCNNEFLWTPSSQRQHYSNKNRRKNMRGPFCSKRCAALGSLVEHHNRDAMSECE